MTQYTPDLLAADLADLTAIRRDIHRHPPPKPQQRLPRHHMVDNPDRMRPRRRHLDAALARVDVPMIEFWNHGLFKALDFTPGAAHLAGNPLVGVSKYNYTAGLLYDKKGLSGRLIWTFRSKYINGDNTGGVVMVRVM